MSAVPVVAVDRLVDRLGHMELQQKQLGLVNQAHGLRLAIMAVLSDDAGAWLAEPPLAPAAAFQFMVASLTGRH